MKQKEKTVNYVTGLPGHLYFQVKYMLDKYKLKEEDVAEWILHDMETDQLKSDVKEKYKICPEEKWRSI